MVLTVTLSRKFADLKARAASLPEQREASAYSRKIEVARRLFAQRSDAEQDLLEIALTLKPNVYPRFEKGYPAFKSDVHAQLEHALYAAKFLSKIDFRKLLTESGFINNVQKIRVYHWHPTEDVHSDYHTFAIFVKGDRKFTSRFVDDRIQLHYDSDKHNIYLTDLKENSVPSPAQSQPIKPPDYAKLSFWWLTL